MMKPDTDIDTEKYSSHNIHNNIKKNSVSSVTSVAKINFTAASHDAAPSPRDERKPTQTVCAAYRFPMPWGFTAASHDAAPSPGDERKPTQTVCAAYRSPMPWGFTAGRNAIRHRNGVMGQWVDKKISYYTFLPTNCKFPFLSCTLPPYK
jgi:hypothetical protein